MFKLMSGVAVVVCAAMAYGGGPGPFKTKWTAKPAGDVKECFVTEDAGAVFGMGKKTLTGFDIETGKPAGTVAINDVTGGKDIDEWTTVSGPTTHMLLLKTEGDDIDEVVGVALPSMKKKWSVKVKGPDMKTFVYLSDLDAVALPIEDTLVLVSAGTGKVLWKKPTFFGKMMRHQYLPEQKLLLTVSYMPGGAMSFGSAFTFGRTQVSCINTETGTTLWDRTYNLVNATKGSVAYQKDYVAISVDGDQVLLMLDYLRVINLQTGKDAWIGVVGQETFKWGGFALEAQQLPMVGGDFIYQTNFNHDVFKTDRLTGKDAWKFDVKGSDYLPKLVVDNGIVLVQEGGYICKEAEIKIQGTLVGYRRNWETNGPFAVAAIDDKTGKQIWTTEELKDGLTRLIVDNGVVYFCTGDKMYALKIADKAQKFVVSHKDAKLGETRWAVDNGDRITVIGEKGLCAYAKADGKRLFKAECDGVDDYRIIGDNFFGISEDKVYTGIDIATGAIKGALATDDFDENWAVSPDGKFFVTIDGKEVTRLAVDK